MQRTLKLALIAVIGAAFVAPAFGQSDNFPDVPDNHWAYEALARMKANGLLVGYPDGLFRGTRPASRYELAVAVHATYVNLKNITDGLQKQIDDLKAANNNANQADIDNLKQALANLQNEVQGLEGLRTDVENLRRLTDTFQKELQDLNVNVEQMKKDLGDLADRVTRLENDKPPISISGDANMWLGAGNSRDGYLGLTKDGYVVGQYTDATGVVRPAGLDRDLTILEEGALRFTTTKNTGAQFSGTVVVGNMLGNGTSGRSGFGNQAALPGQFGNPASGSTIPAFSDYTEGSSDVYLQDFGVKFHSSIAGLGFNVEAGRVGYKISPYILQRPDLTSYYDNERWDNGKYYIDGGIVGFNFSGVKLDVFAGNNSRELSVNGTEIAPTVGNYYQGKYSGAGTFQIDRTLGVNLNVPLTQSGNVDIAYLVLDSNTETVSGGTAVSAGYNLPTAGGFVENNRIAVFGGTANLRFNRFKIEGGYSQSNLYQNDSTVNSDDNAAYYGKLAYNADNWGLWGSYREVEAKFVAPGDWGRLGIERNPTNIKGWQVGGFVNLGQALVLKADGEFDKGKDDGPGGAYALTTGFNTDTEIDKYSVGLDYKVNTNLGLSVGYEDTQFKSLTVPAGGALTGDPHYRWWTFGVGYGLSENTKLKIQYELSDIDHEWYLGPTPTDATYRGGFLTTQLSVKF